LKESSLLLHPLQIIKVLELITRGIFPRPPPSRLSQAPLAFTPLQSSSFFSRFTVSSSTPALRGVDLFTPTHPGSGLAGDWATQGGEGKRGRSQKSGKLLKRGDAGLR
jgi:hypothetical protein